MTIDDKRYIYNELANEGITINPKYESVFSSHVDVLIERLRNNECVNYDDKTFINDIPTRCVEISRKMLKPLFDKYNVEVNETEIGLVAIYIRLSVEKEEE